MLQIATARALVLRRSSTELKRDRLPSLLSEVRYRRVASPFEGHAMGDGPGAHCGAPDAVLLGEWR
jgi:hypothetical protein